LHNSGEGGRKKNVIEEKISFLIFNTSCVQLSHYTANSARCYRKCHLAFN